MKTTIKEITPQWASQVLQTKNPNNRKMSERIIDKYALDMTRGNWALTHQGIAFDLNGDLLDGQHRLAAIVKSGCKLSMPVTVGIERSIRVNGHTASIFGMIDGVRPRTPAAMLAINGHKNAHRVAAIARSWGSMIAPKEVIMSASITEEIVRLSHGSIDAIATIASSKTICRLGSPGLGPIAFWHTTAPEKAEAFLVEVQDVTGKKGSPSRAAATWLRHHDSSSGWANARAATSILTSAIFHEAHGRTAEKLYGGDESAKWLQETNKALAANVRALFK